MAISLQAAIHNVINYGSVWGTLLYSAIPTYSQATKFVTADASGSGDGSLLNPWTLSQAMTNAVAGDIVGVAEGVYVGVDPEAGSGYRYTPAFRPSNSGTALSPIIFVAQNHAAMVTSGYSDIRSGATVAGAGWPAYGVLTKNYIQWVGFYSDETAANNKGCPDSAPATFWSTTGSQILRNKVRGENAPFTDNHAGIRLENFYGGLVKSNDIDGFHTSTGGSVNQAGIQTYQMQNSILEHNLINNCGCNLHIKGAVQFGNTIRFNMLTNATSASMRLGSLTAEAGNPTNRNLIYGNITRGCLSDIELASTAAVPDAMNGTDIFNNTFYTISGTISQISLWISDSVESHDNTFQNNIVYAQGRKSYFNQEVSGNSAQGFANYISSDRNIYFGATYFADGSSGSDWNQIDFTTWKSLTTSDDSSSIADPLFVNAGSGDFNLQEGSPAINFGVDYKNLLGSGTSAPINAGAKFNNSVVGIV